MTFWQMFRAVLPVAPRPALAALYWHATRRVVRARDRLREAGAAHLDAYAFWISEVENLDALGLRAADEIGGWDARPRFAVLLLVQGSSGSDQLLRTIRSLDRQIYADWTLLVVSKERVSVEAGTNGPIVSATACETLAEAVRLASGSHIVPVRAGDVLSEAALFRFAEALQTAGPASLLYGDHDIVERNGKRCRPWFKPEWNEEMFLAQDYLSPAVAIRTAHARESIGETTADIADFELVMAAAEAAQGLIVHVPHVLWHVDPANACGPGSARIDALTRHLAPRGATVNEGPFGTAKVTWPLSETPLVSIIVPTRDKVQLLRNCIDSLLTKTLYRNFEVIVVDNKSTETESLDYLSSIDRHDRVRVLQYDHAYNFSAINNVATQLASGTYLCFLNNDTEVIDGVWLEEMLRYAIRPEVGAVGAKLLYPDGRIQHAGVAVGLGNAAGHSHRFTPNDDPGYFAQAHVSHYVTAVTAACLVVDRAKFEAVGRFDAESLAIAYNDVDLCLKLQDAGWRNVYVPHAVLLHHESASRGDDMAPEHLARYRRELRTLQDRWSTQTYQDRVHHPGLARESEQFRIAL
jgi:GT2 family glycosyltransferase